MSDPGMSATTAGANQAPAVVYVTYAGPAGSRFDREYYVERHLPLVLRAWTSYGLLGVAAFFPSFRSGWNPCCLRVSFFPRGRHQAKLCCTGNRGRDG